jgi:PIN domain nuclease of toxin-antitoxin system
MKVLLDTHIVLYWFVNDSRLSKKQARIIQKASPDQPLFISDISLWEIANLYSLNRIRLNLPLRDWLEGATAPPLVQRIGISPSIAAGVAGLPSTFHRDPADRIIVATAQIFGATLLTHDARIIEADLVPTLE